MAQQEWSVCLSLLNKLKHCVCFSQLSTKRHLPRWRRAPFWSTRPVVSFWTMTHWMRRWKQAAPWQRVLMWQTQNPCPVRTLCWATPSASSPLTWQQLPGTPASTWPKRPPTICTTHYLVGRTEPSCLFSREVWFVVFALFCGTVVGKWLFRGGNSAKFNFISVLVLYILDECKKTKKQQLWLTCWIKIKLPFDLKRKGLWLDHLFWREASHLFE